MHPDCFCLHEQGMRTPVLTLCLFTRPQEPVFVAMTYLACLMPVPVQESRQTVITMMGDRMLLRKPRGRPAAEAKLISPSLAIATMPLTTSSPASAVAVSLPPLAGAAAGAAAVAASPARLPPMAPGGARGASPAKGVHGKGRAGIPRKVLNQYIPPVTTNITTNMTTNTTATVSTPTASPATQETLVATNLTTKADVRPVSVPEYAATPASKPTGGMSAEQRGGVRGLVGMQRVDLAPWGELTEGPPTIDHVGNNSAQHGGIGPQQLVGMHGEGEGKGNGGMGDDNKPLPCSVLLSGGPTTPDRHPAGTAQPMSATAAAAAIRALQVLTTSPPAHATAAAAAAAAQAQAPTQPSSARSSSMSIPVGATSAAGGGGGGGGGSALPEVAVPPLGVNPCMSPSPMQQAQQATTPTHDPAGYAPTMQANPFYASMMAAQQMWQQQGHAGMSMPQGVPMFYMPNPHMPPGAPPTCYWVMAPCPATAPGPMQTMSTMQGMPTMPPQWGPMYLPGMPAPYMVPMQAPMPAETAALSPVPPATGATGAIVRLGSIDVPPPSPRARTLSLGHGSHANLAKLASMDVPPQTPSPRGSTEPATVAADFATHHAMHVTVPAPVMVPGPVPMAPMGMAAPRAEPAASGGPMTLVFPAPAVVEAGPTTQTTHTTSHPPPVAPRQPASDDHNSAATQALQDAFLRQLIDRPDVRGQLVSGAARLHFEGSVAVLTGADGQELFRIVAGGQPLGSA